MNHRPTYRFIGIFSVTILLVAVVAGLLFAGPVAATEQADRTVQETTAAPGETVEIVVEIELDADEGIFIGESFSPAFADVEIDRETPDTAFSGINDANDELFADWSGDNHDGEITLTYLVTIPETASDGDEFRFTSDAQGSDVDLGDDTILVEQPTENGQEDEADNGEQDDEAEGQAEDEGDDTQEDDTEDDQQDDQADTDGGENEEETQEDEGEIQDAPFVVDDFTAPATTIRQGEQLNISGTITNTGSDMATQTVAFRIAGDVVEEGEITLDGGESVPITFSTEATDGYSGETEYGLYTNDDNATATVTIEPEAEQTTPDSETTPTPSGQTDVADETPEPEAQSGFGAVLALLSLSIGLAYARFRPRS